MSKLSLSVAARTPINPRNVVSIKQHKAARKAVWNANTSTVRAEVSARITCACCLGRVGESMHECIPKSAFGNKLKAVNVVNSIWVCGSGTTKCHGYLQRHEILTDIIDGVRVFAANPTNRNNRPAQWLEAGWALFDKQSGGDMRQEQIAALKTLAR